MGKNDVTNYPAQGSAFHCLLFSFIEIDKVMQKEKWDSHLIGQIHDSCILDVYPEELKHVTKTINQITTKLLPETWKWIITPMIVEMEIAPVDEPWANKEKFEF